MPAGQMSRAQQAILAEIGIDVWVSRQSAEAVSDAAAVASVASIASSDASSDIASADALLGLNKEILTCKNCDLHQSRTQAVCGVGSLAADILVIGEAPGVDEDRVGEPFVGAAGHLLSQMLKAIGLDRDSVFITNILKCRPPEDRDPHADEVESCLPYLQRQIQLIRPRLILAVGGVAAHNLLHVDTKVGELRGRVHLYGEQQIPLVVTYHPAYLLRSPAQKSKSWADLLLVQDTLSAANG
jgi:uracil-DNA glycosylase family 4